MPTALLMHIPYETFWKLNPTRMKPIERAYELEQEGQQKRLNLAAWISGLYVQRAVASVLSKGARYPAKPIDIFGKEQKLSPEQEADAFKRFMLQHNAINKVHKEIDV